MSYGRDPQPAIPARPLDAHQGYDVTYRERSAPAVKLVAANVGGLALAAVVLHGFVESPDSRIEHVSSAVIDTCDRDPQNAGPIRQDSSSSGVEHRSAWFNVHGVTAALYGSAASPDSRVERTSAAVADTVNCDPENAGPARHAPSPRDAKHRSTWFNVH